MGNTRCYPLAAHFGFMFFVVALTGGTTREMVMGPCYCHGCMGEAMHQALSDLRLLNL